MINVKTLEKEYLSRDIRRLFEIDTPYGYRAIAN